MPHVHHTGICPADMDASLRFYVDGLGLSVLFDVVLDADLAPLLGVPTTKVRTIFLGDQSQPDAGVLELLDLGDGSVGDEPAGSGLPRRGAFLVSFTLPVEETLARLAELGLGGTPRRMPTPGGGVAATVVDPDGVVVELLDQAVSLG